MALSDLEKEYVYTVNDILSHPQVEKMKSISQHSENMTCFEHSIYVSYISFSICKKLKFNANAAARAGLLHDFHLKSDDEKNESMRKHLFTHPLDAEKNAEHYFGISDLEKNIIRNHMWPLTITRLPTKKEAIVVNIVDKVCALAEFLNINDHQKIARVALATAI